MVFTGDACVNGPFNYAGDADTASWIDVLTQVQSLDVETVVPAHGPPAKRELLQTQKQYFIELRAQVAALIAEGKTLEEIKAAADVPMWKRWTGETKMNLENVASAYRDLTRGPLNWPTGDLDQPGRAPIAIRREPGTEPLKTGRRCSRSRRTSRSCSPGTRKRRCASLRRSTAAPGPSSAPSS